MIAFLRRNADTEFGCFGHLDLWDDGRRIARFPTAEDDWLDNKPSVSCIAPGQYVCRRTMYLKGGYETFEITGVPGRSRILFHSGNTEEDVEGCVLLGKDFGAVSVADEDAPGRPVRTKWAVVQSQKAFQDFMALLAGEQSFTLDVSFSAPGEWRI